MKKIPCQSEKGSVIFLTVIGTLLCFSIIYIIFCENSKKVLYCLIACILIVSIEVAIIFCTRVYVNIKEEGVSFYGLGVKISAEWKEIERIEIVHKKISRYPDKDYFCFFSKKIKKNERCYLEVRKDTIRILSEFNKLELLPQFEWSKMRDKKMQDELVMELQKRF